MSIIAGLVLLLVIYYYNLLVRKKNEVEIATGSINETLKSRYDLIILLVDAVKSYMSYERDVLIKLTRMRMKALSYNTGDEEKIELNSCITGALHQIIDAADNYPNLKTSTNFLQLQEKWTGLEVRISTSRIKYNNAVIKYNSAINTFPGKIIAIALGYKSKMLFEVPYDEALVSNVKSFSYN
ncbi:LemA family protein [Chitinophaga silvatica]|nr:LemA family protein [Chitinophaga silvatica]